MSEIESGNKKMTFKNKISTALPISFVLEKKYETNDHSNDYTYKNYSFFSSSAGAQHPTVSPLFNAEIK